MFCFSLLRFFFFFKFPVSETIQPTATTNTGRWGCRGKDGVNFSDHAVWPAACVWSACVCLFQSRMFWSAGQKVSPPGGPPRRATFSALSGMRAFLVLLQAADSQRSRFGSNSADCSPYVTTKYIVSCQTPNIFRRSVGFKSASGPNTVEGGAAMKAIRGSCRTDRPRN